MTGTIKLSSIGRGLLATACAALVIFGASPVLAAEREFFGAAARVSDTDLAGLRGGFVFPGAFVDIGIEARLNIDGATVSPTTYRFSFSATDGVTANDAPFAYDRSSGGFGQFLSQLAVAQDGTVTTAPSSMPGAATGIFSRISNGASNLLIQQVIDVDIRTNMGIATSSTASLANIMSTTRTTLSTTR